MRDKLRVAVFVVGLLLLYACILFTVGTLVNKMRSGAGWLLVGSIGLGFLIVTVRHQLKLLKTIQNPMYYLFCVEQLSKGQEAPTRRSILLDLTVTGTWWTLVSLTTFWWGIHQL